MKAKRSSICWLILLSVGFLAYCYFLANYEFTIQPKAQKTCREEMVPIDTYEGKLLYVCLSDLLAIGSYELKYSFGDDTENADYQHAEQKDICIVWFQDGDSIRAVEVSGFTSELIPEWVEHYGFVEIFKGSHKKARAVNPKNMGRLSTGDMNKPTKALGFVNFAQDCLGCEGEQRGGVVMSAPWIGTYRHQGRNIPLIFGVTSGRQDTILKYGWIQPYFGEK